METPKSSCQLLEMTRNNMKRAWQTQIGFSPNADGDGGGGVEVTL